MSATILGITDDSATLDEHWARTCERSWTVQATADMSARQVLAALVAQGLTVASPHPNDPASLLKNLSVSMVAAEKAHDGGEVYLWTATASYGPWDPLTHSADGNPVNTPVRFRLDPVVTEEIARTDVVSGDPICNTASDDFDPPVTRDGMRATLTVSRNEASVNLPQLLALSNKVNASPWNGFPAKTVKVSPIRLPERQWSQETGQSYYPMEYIFEYNPDKWTAKVLNQGYREIRSSKRSNILVDGSPATAPCFLSSSGTYLEAPVDESNIIELEFDIYEPVDFSPFNLGSLLS